MVAQDASRQAMGHGLKEVEVLVKGPGAGRESAVRALQAIGLDLTVFGTSRLCRTMVAGRRNSAASDIIITNFLNGQIYRTKN